MRVICSQLMMGNLELDCQNLNNAIDEVTTLITNKMGRATKLGDDVFI
jgi:hypothetical protein